jgi:hypothetical protein
VSFEYIKQSELLTTFSDAKKFMMPLFDPFEEFERIARNRPHPGIAKELPKVTDGTLASIIQEKPKRVIQQIPTGKIKTEDEWLEIVAQYILESVILANADEDAKFIRKCKVAVSKSMIYGGQPAFVKFLNRADYFGTDFVLPYVKDVFLEPGKISDTASNVIMLSTWWSKNQIEALIAKHKKLSDDGGWDLKVLAELITEKPGQKDATQQSPSEKSKQLNNGFYQIVHVFQRGIGASFYSFAPRLADGENVVRTKKNPDPRGIIPIHYMYADQDFSNPLGRGAVEMSGGLQNLIDSEMQMYQYNRALMLNPPIKKWGSFSKSVLKMAPNAIWELGANKDSGDAEPATIDSSALANFPSNYSLMKSQILNLNNSLDTSVSSEAGNPGFSKTDSGVKANSERLGISDNDMRKSFESWFSDVAETMVNLHFAERSGVEELALSEECAVKLQQLHPEAVGPNNTIRINYDTETPKLKFEVDASSSSMKDNETQLEALDSVLERYEKSPILQQIIPPDKVAGIWNSIISSSGVEDAEKLQVEMEADGKIKQGDETQQQPEMTPEMVQQMVQEAMQQEKANDPGEHPVIKLMTSLNIKFTDLDPNSQRQVLQEILGVDATGTLPSEVTQATQIADTHLKADQQAHSQALDAAKLQVEENKTTHDQATKMLEMAHTHEQADNQDQMSQAQFAHTVKQDNKPQPKAGVK